MAFLTNFLESRDTFQVFHVVKGGSDQDGLVRLFEDCFHASDRTASDVSLAFSLGLGVSVVYHCNPSSLALHLVDSAS